MYLVGGNSESGLLNELGEYNLENKTWDKKTTNGADIPARSNASVVVSSNYVYLLGGSGETNVLYDFYKVNLNNFEATKLSNQPQSGGGGDAGVCMNGNLYFFGGKNDYGYTSGIRNYNLTYNYWNVGSVTLPTGISNEGASVVANNTAYICGGSSSSRGNRTELLAFNITNGSVSQVSIAMPAGDYFNSF